MYCKIVALLTLSILAFLSAAAPNGLTNGHTTTVTVTAPAPTTISQCNTGAAQCCNSVQPASAVSAGLVAGLLGVVLEDKNALVGFDCTPLTVIGIGGSANCAQQPVCCTNNNFNGVINIGCTPISL